MRITPSAALVAALLGSAACAEVPEDLTPIEQPAAEPVEATTSDLLDLLAPDFDLDTVLNLLAGGCRTCDEYCGGPPG